MKKLTALAAALVFGTAAFAAIDGTKDAKKDKAACAEKCKDKKDCKGDCKDCKDGACKDDKAAKTPEKKG